MRIGRERDRARGSEVLACNGIEEDSRGVLGIGVSHDPLVDEAERISDRAGGRDDKDLGAGEGIGRAAEAGANTVTAEPSGDRS